MGAGLGTKTRDDTGERALRPGSSRYYAWLFVPPAQRRALAAFDAFCRAIDEVVGGALDPGIAEIKLDWWRGEVAAALAGEPSHPVMQALAPDCTEYGVRVDHLLAVIDGGAADLRHSRFADYVALARWSDLVAGTVGEVTARVLGHTRPQTLDHAHRLALALRLTAIIRDVGADARHGRIRLPLAELQQFGVQPDEILQRQSPWGYSPRYSALMRFQAERAHRSFDEALALLPQADRAAQMPGLMLANMYRALLREIERDDFRVLHQHVSLTPRRKLWVALTTRWRGH